MADSRPNQLYQPLRRIMDGFGVTVGPRDFYWAVNDAYHTAEAEVYDINHADMFESLGPAWQRLLSWAPQNQQMLTILDVGAGTGLTAHFINRFFAHRVSALHLLEPNAAMRGKCAQRISRLDFSCELLPGLLSSLDGEGIYDLVTVNSVLHHIVALEEFYTDVKRLLKVGGVLLTAQDPRFEAKNDPVYQERHERARPQRPTGGILRRLRRRLGIIRRRALGQPLPQHPLARATNEQLLDQGVITRPMDIEYIWAVTDFHVFGQPGGIGQGIARQELERGLAGFINLDYFTYDYFGLGWRNLAPDQKEKELSWWQQGDGHGLQFASAWKLERRGPAD